MDQIDFKHLTDEQGIIVNTIIKSALEAVDPYQSVCRSIQIDQNYLSICEKKYDISNIDRIKLIGMGKAVGAMAAAVIKKIGGLVDGGVLVAKHDVSAWNLPESIRIYYGSHPIPSEKSVKAAESLVDFLKNVAKNDLVISLISGGGSALVTKPIAPISIGEMQVLTSLLLESGADIEEINTIRKHLDALKGGGIAEIAGQAQMATLILSDVLGDDISMIASGPTCADETTFTDADRLIRHYELEKKIPQSILGVIDGGIRGEIAETLKPGSRILKSKRNYIIGNLTNAIEKAIKTATDLGLHTQVISTCMVGEAKEVGKFCGTVLKSMKSTDLVISKPGLVIGGGETTVIIKGDGKGGRNQEIAFGAMHEIAGLDNCAVISIATDGEDGPTDAAGAYVTGYTLTRANEMGLQVDDFGENNNTYALFDQTANLIKIGPTGTNVNDLLFLFAF